jgi:hypothetical protein
VGVGWTNIPAGGFTLGLMDDGRLLQMHVSCGDGTNAAQGAFSIKHLVGFRSELLFDVCAQQIAKKIAGVVSPTPPLLLGQCIYI